MNGNDVDSLIEDLLKGIDIPEDSPENLSKKKPESWKEYILMNFKINYAKNFQSDDGKKPEYEIVICKCLS